MRPGASVLISVLWAVSVVRADYEHYCTNWEDAAGKSWDYATTVDQRVEFYSVGDQEPSNSILSFDFNKVNLIQSKECTSERASSPNCDVAWKYQEIIYAAMGFRTNEDEDRTRDWDFAVATRTGNRRFHAIHLGSSSRMPCDLHRIFASRVSSIMGLAYSNGQLFWAECDSRAKPNFNGIYRMDLMTTSRSRIPVAEIINGTENFDICNIRDFVLDAANPDIVSKEEFTFFWVNQKDFVKPSIVKWTYNTDSQAAQAEVVTKDRNPHGLEVVDGFLYWANNPSYVAWYFFNSKEVYTSLELKKYEIPPIHRHQHPKFPTSMNPVTILKSGKHAVTSLGVTCAGDVVLSDAVRQRSYIVKENDYIGKGNAPVLLNRKMSRRRVPSKIVSKASVLGCPK